MPSTSPLISKLQATFPEYAFAAGDEFRWSPDEQTIIYDPSSDDQAALLHELSHAILNHTSYMRDVHLLDLERDAWQYAIRELSVTYGVPIPIDQVESSLDTYRDWLHARSICPNCGATGIQTKSDEYKCVACYERWRVNDARICALRRYRVF